MQTTDPRWLVLAAPEGPDPHSVDQLRGILDRAGLEVGHNDPLLRTPAGALPIIGGEITAVESSWLGEGAHTPYLQVHGVSANLEQCGLLFDLAVAGRLLIGVEPSPPHAIICGEGLDPADLVDISRPPWLDIYCQVTSAEQLHDCLHGDVETYRYIAPGLQALWGPRSQWPED